MHQEVIKAKIKFLNAQIERKEKAVETYASLNEYWSSSDRRVYTSIRLNQTQEFLDHQVAYTRDMVLQCQDELLNLQDEVSMLNAMLYSQEN